MAQILSFLLSVYFTLLWSVHANLLTEWWSVEWKYFTQIKTYDSWILEGGKKRAINYELCKETPNASWNNMSNQLRILLTLWGGSIFIKFIVLWYFWECLWSVNFLESFFAQVFIKLLWRYQCPPVPRTRTVFSVCFLLANTLQILNLYVCLICNLIDLLICF